MLLQRSGYRRSHLEDQRKKRIENRLRLSVSSPSAGLPSEVVREVEDCTQYLGDPQGRPRRLHWSRRVLCGVAHGCRHSCTLHSTRRGQTSPDRCSLSGTLRGTPKESLDLLQTRLLPMEVVLCASNCVRSRITITIASFQEGTRST